MKRIISIVALAGLALAACSNKPSDVADKMMEDAEAAGIEVDRACVDEAAANLSADDVKSLEVGNTPTANAERVRNLMNTTCLTDAEILEQMGALPEGVDQQCVLDAVHNLTIDQMDDAEGNMANAVAACLTVGG